MISHGLATDVDLVTRKTILYILFNKHRVGVSRKTGTVMNKNELVYPERALLKFTGAGETGDWKILKVGFSLAVHKGG